MIYDNIIQLIFFIFQVEDSDYIFMQEKLFIVLLHMKKLKRQIVCNHPVATGHLCCKLQCVSEQVFCHKTYIKNIIQ